jgi:hypothetical protein
MRRISYWTEFYLLNDILARSRNVASTQYSIVQRNSLKSIHIIPQKLILFNTNLVICSGFESARSSKRIKCLGLKTIIGRKKGFKTKSCKYKAWLDFILDSMRVVTWCGAAMFSWPHALLGCSICMVISNNWNIIFSEGCTYVCRLMQCERSDVCKSGLDISLFQTSFFLFCTYPPLSKFWKVSYSRRFSANRVGADIWCGYLY